MIQLTPQLAEISDMQWSQIPMLASVVHFTYNPSSTTSSTRNSTQKSHFKNFGSRIITCSVKSVSKVKGTSIKHCTCVSLLPWVWWLPEVIVVYGKVGFRLSFALNKIQLFQIGLMYPWIVDLVLYSRHWSDLGLSNFYIMIYFYF